MYNKLMMIITIVLSCGYIKTVFYVTLVTNYVRKQ